MEYFGKNTDEQALLDFLDARKETKGWTTQELISKLNKVIDYYRESVMYDFDEAEFPSNLDKVTQERTSDGSGK